MASLGRKAESQPRVYPIGKTDYDAAMAPTPKHRLRWYQYSLRSLFVLTVLVAIAGSWYAWKRQQVERQRAVVKLVEELGGEVEYDYQRSSLGTFIPNAEPPGPAWLRSLLGDDFFANVTGVVGLTYTEISDAKSEYFLERLKGSPQLKELSLGGTQVTDAVLEHLKRLPQLKTLNLGGAQVTDAGIELLKGLPQLKEQWTALSPRGTVL
jgi:hypothetical protein